MGFWTYVLKSISFGTLYVGNSSDPDRRLIEHNEGRSRYTKGRKPWTLIHRERYNTRAEAMRRERFLKSGQGREELKRLLQLDNYGEVAKWSNASDCKSDG